MNYNYVLKGLLNNGFAGIKVRHFKGKDYQVLGVAQHTETGDKSIIWRL